MCIYIDNSLSQNILFQCILCVVNCQLEVTCCTIPTCTSHFSFFEGSDSLSYLDPLTNNKRPSLSVRRMWEMVRYNGKQYLQVCSQARAMSNICIHIWVFPKIRGPQNGWLIMENPITSRVEWFGGTTIFGTSIWTSVAWTKDTTSIWHYGTWNMHKKCRHLKDFCCLHYGTDV